MILGNGDFLFKKDEKAVGGILLWLINTKIIMASLVHWKSKQIDRVCHFLKMLIL